MSTFKDELTVHYEDGETATVTVGQREMAAFEAQPFANANGTHLAMRFMAYDALRRSGKLPRDRKDRQVTWDAWSDLVDVVAPPEVFEDERDDEPATADPTQTDQPEAR